MSIGNISLFDVYFSTLPYSLCVCACVYRVCVCDCKYMCVCVCACVWDREREGLMDERTDEKESHCVGCHCFCAVCVDCTTAPTLHTHRPSSQCSVDCMTAILSSPPPLPAHTPTYHTPPHTDIAQPPRAVLTAWLSGLCVCSVQLCRRSGGAMARSPEDCSVYFWEPLHRHRTIWPVCVCSAQLCRRSGGTMARSPEDCSIYFWEPLHRQCPPDIVFNSSAGAYDWVVNMDCVDSGSDPGVSSIRTTAAKSTATQKFTKKRIRRFR